MLCFQFLLCLFVGLVQTESRKYLLNILLYITITLYLIFIFNTRNQKDFINQSTFYTNYIKESQITVVCSPRLGFYLLLLLLYKCLSLSNFVNIVNNVFRISNHFCCCCCKKFFLNHYTFVDN